MILIVSNVSHEATALASLCTQRRWPCAPCGTFQEFTRLADKAPPRVIVTRQQFRDGYSDDVLSYLAREPHAGIARTIVLVPADCPAKEEARQVALGAEYVFRDPVRITVLLEMIARYRNRVPTKFTAPLAPAPHFQIAGVDVFPHELRLASAGRDMRTTPRVIELLQLLHRNAGRVVPYALLYSELFGRNFGGETANCRVLLAKADCAFRQLGVNFRHYLKVIPKSGYLYSAQPETKQPKNRRR